MRTVNYQRDKAVEYAREYALKTIIVLLRVAEIA